MVKRVVDHDYLNSRGHHEKELEKALDTDTRGS